MLGSMYTKHGAVGVGQDAAGLECKRSGQSLRSGSRRESTGSACSRFCTYFQGTWQTKKHGFVKIYHNIICCIPITIWL